MTRRSLGRAEQQWRQRLDRFEQSGQTIRAFCADEQVSEPSFYHWRRRLGHERIEVASAEKPAFQPIHVTSSVGVLAVHLANGTRVEVPADQLELARAVVREVARAARVDEAGGA